MSTPTPAPTADDSIRPRPGVVQALGVLNLLISSLMLFATAASLIWVVAIRYAVAPDVPKAAIGTRPIVGTAVVNIGAFGMDDPAFFRFTIVQSIAALALNGMMFATGLGLVNLRGWGARWWARIAWAKILGLFLIWGSYIVLVTPSLSVRMAESLIASSSFPPGRSPTIADVTRIYAIFNLIVAVAMIAFGSIYPAASLWILGRPGVRKALDRPDGREEAPT